MADLLERLPRGWWGVELPGYRDHPAFTTYGFDSGALPPIERDLDDELRWLLNEAPVPASLAERHPFDPEPHRGATREQLDLLVGSRGLTLPRSFRTFTDLAEPRRRVRSCTAC